MKKKMLEALPLLPATDQMVEMVKNDVPQVRRTYYTFSNNITFKCYERYFYFRAMPVADNVLMIAMYLRRDIARGERNPRFNIFLDKTRGEQATYDCQENKWREASIENLCWDSDIREKGMEYQTGFYADAETTTMVNTYLEAERQEVKTLIQKFQIDLKKDKLEKAHARESSEIDETMALVPPIPADFEKWVTEYGLYKDRYIFYHADGKKKEKPAYCMQCGSSFMADRPKKNKKCKCPACKKTALLLPWTSKNIRSKHDICLIQRLKDGTGWVTRRFRVLLIAKKQDNWKPNTYIDEEVRDIYSNDLIQYGHFEYGQYKTTGIIRWCYTANEPSRKSYYYDDYEMGEARVYWKNIKKERQGTSIRYIPLESALSKSPGTYIGIKRMMKMLREHKEIEYFIKMGFKRLSVDMLNEKLSFKIGKKPWEVLGISKDLMQDALKYDVSARELHMMRAAEECGYKLTKTEMKFFSQYFNETDICKILRYATPHRMYRYYTETLKNVRNYGDYIDYLDAAEKCRYDMRNEMVLFPKNFRQAHDMAAQELEQQRQRIADMKIRQKNKEYAKMLPQIKAMYEFEDEEFYIKVPEKMSDFTQEGHMNHNCVATYFDRVVRGETVVVFLRKKALPDQAYCTVEITNVASIKQLRSNYNRQAPPEAEKFAKRWMKEVRKRLKKEESKKKKNAVRIQVAAG